MCIRDRDKSLSDARAHADSDSELKTILSGCCLEELPPNEAGVLQNAIERLWYAERFTVDGAELPREKIRADLLHLHADVLAGALKKLRENTRPIRNTTAYVMANKFGIVHKLPILIVEKMGPHFALGDTCYSRAEDHKVYNPDGKEIIARDNEVSALRLEAPEKAYFNCHTDITIPYDEIGEIAAVLHDGSRIPVIANGRFVLPGAEILNEPLEGK